MVLQDLNYHRNSQGKVFHLGKKYTFFMVKLKKNFLFNLIPSETCFITFRYKMMKLEAQNFLKLHCIMKFGVLYEYG